MIILVDVRYILYRSHFTTGALSFGDVPTGSIFGLLQTLKTFHEAYQDCRFLLCHDGGIPQFRYEACPEYKGNRDSVGNDVRDTIDMQERIIQSNAPLSQWVIAGYEADDLIASFCTNWKGEGQIGIITNDRDLYSLLTDKVFIRKSISDSEFTVTSLIDEYGVQPDIWPLVKALAGDKSDNITGLRGYKEKRASKAIREGSIDFKDPQIRDLVQRNLQVVQLVKTLEGWPEPQAIDTLSWNSFCSAFGIVKVQFGESIFDVQDRIKTLPPGSYDFPE
jgi:5'-3' exonuclease